MEGVRRDPEKCTFNPTTWSLTVVDDYVLYVFALSTPNLQRKLFGGGGVLPVLEIQFFWLIN